jgi:hypothetical protein
MYLTTALPEALVSSPRDEPQRAWPIILLLFPELPPPSELQTALVIHGHFDPRQSSEHDPRCAACFSRGVMNKRHGAERCSS